MSVECHGQPPIAIAIALNTAIVAYCSNPDCDDSVVTAQRLQELGYTKVHHYPRGKDDWRDFGLPLERAGKPYVPG